MLLLYFTTGNFGDPNGVTAGVLFTSFLIWGTFANHLLEKSGKSHNIRKLAVYATHLPEFTQVEGIIVEPEANFGMLIGVLKEFYRRMGFPDVRVRPAYFPYTEPSMEVEVKFGDSWLELGGSGIFRPEVTAPFGIDCPVLAWGLGLERLAMLRLGIKDIRMLYQSDLQWLKETI
jgi:phenylalanyl-tRNA synthetase alpha chain